MGAFELAGIAVGGMLALAGAITTLGAAAEKIAKVIRAAKAPGDAQNDRLDALELWKRGVDQKLDNDNRQIRSFAEGDRVTKRALLALLDHGIDGNNIDQMQRAKNDLQAHLIDK